jgi:hypothetical protein
MPRKCGPSQAQTNRFDIGWPRRFIGTFKRGILSLAVLEDCAQHGRHT